MFGPALWRFGGMTDPLREVQRLQQEMNRVFSGLDQAGSRENPPINAWVGESDVIVTSEIPGIDPAGVELSVVGDTLTISGAREPEGVKEGENYHRQERSELRSM